MSDQNAVLIALQRRRKWWNESLNNAGTGDGYNDYRNDERLHMNANTPKMFPSASQKHDAVSYKAVAVERQSMKRDVSAVIRSARATAAETAFLTGRIYENWNNERENRVYGFNSPVNVVEAVEKARRAAEAAGNTSRLLCEGKEALNTGLGPQQYIQSENDVDRSGSFHSTKPSTLKMENTNVGEPTDSPRFEDWKREHLSEYREELELHNRQQQMLLDRITKLEALLRHGADKRPETIYSVDYAVDEAKRKAKEEEAKRKAEEEEAKRKAEEEEAKRKAEEEEAKRKAEEEEAKRKAEEEEARRKAEEEEAKRKAEEEAKRKAEEEDLKRKAEEEVKRKAEEEAKRKAEEEAKRKAEEEDLKRKAEEEVKRKAEEEAKRKAEEEAKRKAEEEAKRKAEEEEAKRKAEEEEEAKRKAEEEAKRKAEEEAKRKAEEEEAKRKAEEEVKRKAEEEAKRKAEEEEAKRKAEEEEAKRKAQGEEANSRVMESEKLKIDEEEKQHHGQKKKKMVKKVRKVVKKRAVGSVQETAEEETKRKLEVGEIKRKDEEEAKRKAEEEEAKRKAEEEEAKRKAEEEEAKRKAEEEAKRKAEEEAKRKAEEEEAKRKAEEEAKRKAEKEAKRKAEEEKLKLEVAEAAKRIEEAQKKAEEKEKRRKAEEEAKRKAEAQANEETEEEGIERLKKQRAEAFRKRQAALKKQGSFSSDQDIADQTKNDQTSKKDTEEESKERIRRKRAETFKARQALLRNIAGKAHAKAEIEIRSSPLASPVDTPQFTFDKPNDQYTEEPEVDAEKMRRVEAFVDDLDNDRVNQKEYEEFVTKWRLPILSSTQKTFATMIKNRSTPKFKLEITHKLEQIAKQSIWSWKGEFQSTDDVSVLVDAVGAVVSDELPAAVETDGVVGVSNEEEGDHSFEARAIYDFAPTLANDGQLPLHEGDIVKVLETSDSGWWRGILNGSVGEFPGSYVEMLQKTGSIPGQSRAVALYNYDARSPDELSIDVNLSYVVTGVTSDGVWYTGCCDSDPSKKGLFPASYVNLDHPEITLLVIEDEEPVQTTQNITSPFGGHGFGVLIQSQIVLRRYVRRFKKAVHRRKAGREMLSSEVSYCNGLISLQQSYEQPLKRAVETGEISSLTAGHIQSIFCNLNDLITLSEDLKTKLDICVKSWSTYQARDLEETVIVREARIAEIFLEAAERLSNEFSTFVAGYSEAVRLVSELATKCPDFASFLDRSSSQQAGLLRVSSLLILPVQRVPRYLLLLQDMAKHMDSDHPHRPKLLKACEAVRSSALRINENQRHAENHIRVKDIESQVEGIPEKLYTDTRLFVKEGQISLAKSGFKRIRTAFLFNDALLLAKPVKTGDKSLFKFKELIKFESSFAQFSEDINQIVVTSAGKRFVLLTKIPRETIIWYEEIHNCISSTKLRMIGQQSTSNRNTTVDV